MGYDVNAHMPKDFAVRDLAAVDSVLGKGYEIELVIGEKMLLPEDRDAIYKMMEKYPKLTVYSSKNVEPGTFCVRDEPLRRSCDLMSGDSGDKIRDFFVRGDKYMIAFSDFYLIGSGPGHKGYHEIEPVDMEGSRVLGLSDIMEMKEVEMTVFMRTELREWREDPWKKWHEIHPVRAG